MKKIQISDPSEIDELKYYIDSFNDTYELDYEEDLKTMIFLKLKLTRDKNKSKKITTHIDKVLSAYKRYYFTL
ncbi:MAG: hypothetical protein ABI550_06055 [Ignavibacteriaceae bacterium]